MSNDMFASSTSKPYLSQGTGHRIIYSDRCLCSRYSYIPDVGKLLLTALACCLFLNGQQAKHS